MITLFERCPQPNHHHPLSLVLELIPSFHPSPACAQHRGLTSRTPKKKRNSIGLAIEVDSFQKQHTSGTFSMNVASHVRKIIFIYSTFLDATRTSRPCEKRRATLFLPCVDRLRSLLFYLCAHVDLRIYLKHSN